MLSTLFLSWMDFLLNIRSASFTFSWRLWPFLPLGFFAISSVNLLNMSEPVSSSSLSDWLPVSAYRSSVITFFFWKFKRNFCLELRKRDIRSSSCRIFVIMLTQSSSFMTFFSPFLYRYIFRFCNVSKPLMLAELSVQHQPNSRFNVSFIMSIMVILILHLLLR